MNIAREFKPRQIREIQVKYFLMRYWTDFQIQILDNCKLNIDTFYGDIWPVERDIERYCQLEDMISSNIGDNSIIFLKRVDLWQKISFHGQQQNPGLPNHKKNKRIN